MKRLLPAIFTAILLTACSGEEADSPAADTPSPLVIEGWIEDEAKPVVIITRAADMSAPTGPVEDMMQRWCRVTVSDGEESEILAMHIDDRYLPPVIYTSSRLRGKVGHTYTLTVETDVDTVTAVTTIPPVARIDSLRAFPADGDAAMLNVKLFTNPATADYYKIFTRVNSEKRYYSAFLGTFAARDYISSKGWNAARGIHQTHADRFVPNYAPGDTVNVKLCTMDAAAYDFWQSYEAAVSLQGNFFFTSTDECRGNIEGGKGYWAGYGTSFARIIVPATSR